jgi:hypothetical protein
MAWHRFASVAEYCPILNLPDPMLLQHFRLGLLEGSGMKLDVISGRSFVLLEPKGGKEILGEIRDFGCPPILSDKVAEHGNEELHRSIFEGARAYIPTFSMLWSKISFLTSSSFRFPYRFFS